VRRGGAVVTALVLVQWWTGLLCLAGAAAAALVSAVMAVRRRRRRHGASTGLANVDRVAESTVFRRVRRRYLILVGAELALLGIVAFAATGLAMRPVREHPERSQSRNRDVMLCLDVSGSMSKLDADVMQRFADIARSLEGERIGLTIFSGSAVTVFPLTDDYEFVASTLGQAMRSMESGDSNFVLGTDEGGTSLIGDGLVSCAIRFDRLDEPRARSIIFATDNNLAGVPIMSMAAATAYVATRDIRMYAIAPADADRDDFAELVASAEQTGGAAYAMTADASSVVAIVDGISRLERSAIDKPPEVIVSDQPRWWMLVCLAGAGALAALGWGLRR
jgi:Ca-activated chloride channel homolog